ncbi:putative membrane protein [Candidatus Kuenenia stuttgartiensis]|uniref:Putative membrane protein n=1 Tax=Kuenenia stuttgartiensis TaxID=174633 RepID=A0A2C9CE85_KUEST|nr:MULTISPECIES: hypothetical protein [Kuenenia]MBZ0190325.1 hypothetical protein [Candidatus Kuenenia stuttgartiensis]MCL4725898.1 hypothetical protein [Candidatus Kuenenia stuttgartiensis]MCZ7623923.1 hypothetical protein [Candidatus Kuenenia sp.]QII10121.1 putative membrane protein [Candidatus Kuenenia stuttgartiensis]SOH04011.1 hypothetical protein KSMBR1_1512 [Candidatus Kuenenia stuttgartiensis]
MEFIFKLITFTAAIVALILLAKARHGKTVTPAIVSLVVCLGFDLLEEISLFYKKKLTIEVATLETFTAILVIITLIYAFLLRREERFLGYAILCTALTATLCGLELIFFLFIKNLGIGIV